MVSGRSDRRGQHLWRPFRRLARRSRPSLSLRTGRGCHPQPFAGRGEAFRESRLPSASGRAKGVAVSGRGPGREPSPGCPGRWRRRHCWLVLAMVVVSPTRPRAATSPRTGPPPIPAPGPSTGSPALPGRAEPPWRSRRQLEVPSRWRPRPGRWVCTWSIMQVERCTCSMVTPRRGCPRVTALCRRVATIDHDRSAERRRECRGARLSTITRADGSMQVVYGRYPLYYSVGTPRPAERMVRAAAGHGGCWARTASRSGTSRARPPSPRPPPTELRSRLTSWGE